MVQVELLGRPGLVVDGHRRSLPGRQPALLAALALVAPRPVPAERLVDVLWADALPADPANALQQRISALRRIVGTDRVGDVLVRGDRGYALQLDDEAIDARRFARVAARGAELLATGDHAGAVTELRAGLALWRAEALEGFAHELWAEADAARLEELRLTATEDLHDAALVGGAGAELVGDLTEGHARHPLRERPAGQLMLALCRAERQADALQVYDRTRRRLAEELGVDPGPALQRIYRQVLDRAEVTSPAADPTARTGPSAATAPPTRVDNLPAATTTLIGRDEAAAELVTRLADTRCLTLTGPGGTGKTTLGLEVARRHPRPVHGTWLVELASLPGRDAVLGELAAVLGVGSVGVGAGEVRLDVLMSALRDRQLLLVLDNAEHVVEVVAELVDDLLGAAPRVRVLVTSREPLGIPGEQVWSVPPLELPDLDGGDAAITTSAAVRLLRTRARQHDPWFELDDADALAAADLVRQLDGIPLAIELAAAQLRVRSLVELVASLDDRLSLASSDRVAPPRQRTLRGALDWSWDLLDDVQRRAWAALSVTSGPVDLGSAGRLLVAAGVAAPAVEVLRDLVDRSLLVTERHGRTTRFRSLVTLRTYGRERLRDLGLVEAVTEVHATLVEDGLSGALGPDGDPSRFRVDLDELAAWLDDARAVLARAAEADDRRRVQRVAGRLGWVWLLRGSSAEGLGWLDRALGPLDAVDPEDVDPAAVLWASGLRVGQAHVDGRGWAALAVAVADRPDDRVVALTYAAVHAAHAGDLDGAWRGIEEARASAAELGGWPLGFAELVAAQLGRLTGHVEGVRADAEAALSDLEGAGDLAWAQGLAFDILVDAILDEEGPAAAARARDLATEGLRRCTGRRLPELESRLRLQLGRALHELGEVEIARRHVEVGVRLAERVGQDVALGFALVAAGRLARARGEHDVAVAELQRARVLVAGSGVPFGTVEANVELAWSSLALGDVEGARDAAARALDVAETVGEPTMLDRAREVVAAVVAGPEPPPAR